MDGAPKIVKSLRKVEILAQKKVGKFFYDFSAVDFGALGGAAGIKQTYGEGGEGLNRWIALSNGWRGPCIFLKISRLVTAENSLPLRSGIKRVI